MRQITLNGLWKMREAGESTDGAAQREYTAEVPGSVLSVLLDAGAIPDPYVGRNEYAARELFCRDYWFWREFELDSEFLENEEISLVCLGLDTLAKISINGKEVFYADNMHRRWEIPVKDVLRPGKNELRILFLSALNYIDEYSYGENKEIQYVPCGAMKGNQLIRKAHSMFGWDWGPQLPDMGIFRDIFLEGWTGRKILDVRIHQKYDPKKADSAAEIRIFAEFSSDEKKAENQKIRVWIADEETGEIQADLREDLGNFDFWEGEFVLEHPRLWWPNGYGEQPLYTVHMVLENPDGSVKQEQKRTIGIRTLTVSRERDEWGREFAFMVNGVKLFAMGANYIPEDCIYSRITEERQKYLLTSAKRAHFNCIRVWGGGYYPSDTFYELCDRLGLIVWQDLMFACNVYDATEAFLENCRQEVIDNVKRLRHHPCLGLWCGNNEIESAWHHWEDFQKESMYLRADYIKLFEQVLPRAVKEHDPDTFYWPSSPSSGGCFDDPDAESDGDCHYWDVWHGQKPFTDYRKHCFRFCSEFGFQSFPCLKTVKAFAEPEDWNIFSRVMESHQKNDAANGKILYYLSENFCYPSDFEQFLYVSQVLQAMAIQYGVEHWRRNRGRCMGTLYWQLNDNWPAASWSSIDYFGRWKALHYLARRFFAPMASSIAVNGQRAELFLENETRFSHTWKARLMLKTMDCAVCCQVCREGTIEPLSSKKVLEIDLESFAFVREPDWEERVFIEARVCFDEGLETEARTQNVETLLPYKYLKRKKPKIRVCVEEREDEFSIVLSSDGFAPFVELGFADADVIFSDNVMHLTETGSRRIALKKQDIVSGSFSGPEDVLNRLTVRTLFS